MLFSLRKRDGKIYLVSFYIHFLLLLLEENKTKCEHFWHGTNAHKKEVRGRGTGIKWRGSVCSKFTVHTYGITMMIYPGIHK
jgi:hypothetical protein